MAIIPHFGGFGKLEGNMKHKNGRIIQDDANGVVIGCRSGVEQMEDVQRYRKQSVPKVLIRNRRKHFIPKGKVVGH